MSMGLYREAGDTAFAYSHPANSTGDSIIIGKVEFSASGTLPWRVLREIIKMI